MSEAMVSASESRRSTRRRARPNPAPDPAGGIDRRQLLEALTRLKRGDFTVRLDDNHTGYGVAERIRKFLSRTEITLVAMTGRTHPDDLHRIVASGFDDYLAKPISFDKVDALLTAKLSVRERSSPNRTPG